MPSGTNQFPDRMYIDEEDRAIIKAIDDHPEEDVKQLLSASAPANRSRKEQFLYFMAVGIANSTYVPVKKRESGGFFLLKDLKPEDDTMISAVAILHEGKADVLSDRSKVLEIAEGYAHAGIRFVVDSIANQPGSLIKKTERDLWSIHVKLGEGTNTDDSEQ